MFTFALMIGVGAASIISRALGSGRQNGGNRMDDGAGNHGDSAWHCGDFSFAAGEFLGATESIAPYAEEYLRFILLGFPVITLTVIGHNVARAEGHPEVALILLIIGALSNIALDALFIFGFNQGIKGAAIATIIARCFSLSFLMWYFRRKQTVICFSLHCFKPDFAAARRILSLGVPAFVRQNILLIPLVFILPEFFYKEAAGKDIQAGMILAHQTFGDMLRWDPHFHCLVLEGGFDDEVNFVYIHFSDLKKMTEYFRRKVINLFLKDEMTNEDFARILLSWKDSGFSIENSVQILTDKARINLSEYISRAPLSLKKLRYEPFKGRVLFHVQYSKYFSENV